MGYCINRNAFWISNGCSHGHFECLCNPLQLFFATCLLPTEKSVPWDRLHSWPAQICLQFDRTYYYSSRCTANRSLSNMFCSSWNLYSLDYLSRSCWIKITCHNTAIRAVFLMGNDCDGSGRNSRIFCLIVTALFVIPIVGPFHRSRTCLINLGFPKPRWILFPS